MKFIGLTDKELRALRNMLELMRHIVINKGTIIAIAHNHPCGSPSPSKNDDLLTTQISKACDIMRIFFMDHIIIGDNAYYSYHDKGRV